MMCYGRTAKIVTHALCALAMVLLAACSGSSDDGGVDAKANNVQVQVSGTVRYEDKEYGAYGFTGNAQYKAVRHAVVDLVDVYNRVIATTVTDESGFYQLSGTGASPRVRVLAQTDAVVGTRIAVHDFEGNLYAVSQELVVKDEAEVEVQQIDFDLAQDGDIAGAFNMLDVFTSSTQFVSELTNTPLPALNAYWQNKNSSYGTYYCFGSRKNSSCPQGQGIYILGGRSSGGDTDHYDDDVLFHEYAHYIEGMVGAQDSPGGVHYLTENDQDLRLTWSEGLGGFFPVAVKTWLAEKHPHLLSSAENLPTTYFIDTYGSYVGISLDMNDPNRVFCPGGNDCYVYSSSEIAIAKILIGLMNEFGMQSIWDAYSSYMAGGTVLPATLETFWDGWMLQRVPASEEYNSVKNIFNERQVYYQEDGFEMDNHLGALRKTNVCMDSLCNGEVHHLYYQDLDNDRDLVAFDANKNITYKIETLDLSNGADTYIRILDSTGNMVFDVYSNAMVNDNRPGTTFCGEYDNPCRVHNDDVMLSSELNFSPAANGTYYIEVTTSPSKPEAAGRYGTYTLQISH